MSCGKVLPQDLGQVWSTAALVLFINVAVSVALAYNGLAHFLSRLDASTSGS